MKRLIIVRGGGELATGVVHTLYRAGFRVLVLEQAKPYATRRRVAFSEAMYNGESTVERVTCYRVSSIDEAKARLKKGELVMLKDAKAKCVKDLKPLIVVDAIVAHENLGTTRDMAAHTIALGPGFCAGRDVDVVVETMRGHNLGRLIYEGYSFREQDLEKSTVGIDRNIEHLVFAPADGVVDTLYNISFMVNAGENIARLKTVDDKTIDIKAGIDGVLRGALHRGTPVKKGQKIADVNPTMSPDECFTISDKARCIGGAVLTAVMIWESKQPKRSFFHRG